MQGRQKAKSQARSAGPSCEKKNASEIDRKRRRDDRESMPVSEDELRGGTVRRAPYRPSQGHPASSPLLPAAFAAAI
jgi:hypothetical protein